MNRNRRRRENAYRVWLVRGRVVKGLGVGGKYISHPYYSSKFRNILGCTPFPGTLNIESDTDWRELAASCKPIVIEHTTWDGVELGAVYLWFARVKGIKEQRITLIRPLKSRHKPNIVELVSCIKLMPYLPNPKDVVIEVECVEDPYILPKYIHKYARQ